MEQRTSADGRVELGQFFAPGEPAFAKMPFRPFEHGHSIRQFPGAPWSESPLLKFMSCWYIKTPPGYSTMFTAPFCRSSADLPMHALSGVVETDRMQDVINFPMAIRRPLPFVISKGTPLVQAIPFKRNDWNATIGPHTEQGAGA